MDEPHDGSWLPRAELADRHQAWDFIRALAAAYGRPVADNHGTEPAALDAAEARLGLRLPTALRETYLQFGWRRDLLQSQDKLLVPMHLRVDPIGKVLVFRVECEGCTSWGVRLTDLELDDPPVLMESTAVVEGWEPYADRLSLAVVETVLLGAMFSADGDRVANLELDDPSLHLLETEYDLLGLPELPVWAGGGAMGIRWFRGPDVLLYCYADTWLWVHGRSAEAVEVVRRTIPGAWNGYLDESG